MRTPGYGVGYVVGPILIERLMTERITQQADDFNMQEFMDRFMETGFMQIPLIRWEMTGRKPLEQSDYWK